MSMADDYREHDAFVRDRKNSREAKFEQNFGFIKDEARAIGYTLSHDKGAWLFESDTHAVRWWPGSGKTATGDHYGTWPALKAALLEDAQ